MALGLKKIFSVQEDADWFGQFYRPSDNKVPVAVSLRFKNSEANKMGMPLPEGVVRVYKADDGGSLQFAGEDRLAHTPKDEVIELKLGKAFDVVAEKKQTDFQVINANVIQSSWEIRLRNHKTEAITVSIVEPLNVYGEWNVVNASDPFIKKDAWTLGLNSLWKRMAKQWLLTQ